MNKKIKKIFTMFAVLSVLIAIGFSLAFISKLRNDYKEKTAIVSKNFNYIEKKTEELPKKYEQIAKEETQRKIKEAKEKSEPTEESAKEQIYPASGKIITPYSDSEIVYLTETGDYRTHQGIDIETEGKNAVVIADGIVRDVYEDLNNHYVVCVEHDDFVSIYKNIIINTEIYKGRQLSKGDPVGKGITDENNREFIHFEVEKNGIKDNPEKYFK